MITPKVWVQLADEPELSTGSLKHGAAGILLCSFSGRLVPFVDIGVMLPDVVLAASCAVFRYVDGIALAAYLVSGDAEGMGVAFSFEARGAVVQKR